MRFKRIDWSADVAKRLENALSIDADLIEQDVRKNRASLYEINYGDSYMVARIESEGEFVVVAFEGKNLLEVVPHVMANAQREGCKSIRFHTQRPGLVRLLKDYNPQPLEYVCRINVVRSN